MRKRLMKKIVYSAISTILFTCLFSGPISAINYESNDPPFWEGTVTLVENSFIKIIANNSGNVYDVSSTSALGALDAASKIGDFQYTVNDVWYDSFGLLVDSISDKGNEGWDGWQYWINYPDEEIPMISADSYELQDNEIVDWFYGGYGVNPDNTIMLIRINVNIIPDNTNPEITLLKPSSGAIYIHDDQLINLPIRAAIIFGDITIGIEASDSISSIKKIDVYIDDSLKETLNIEPYSWLWQESSFGKKTIKLIAYDQVDNSASIELKVFKFSI